MEENQSNLKKDPIEKELDEYSEVKEERVLPESQLNNNEKPKIKKSNKIFYIILVVIVILGIVSIISLL
ncbi:MAG TPA: hypothetical protein PKL13_03620 [bacterium]|nr:hypothetical protein [bacterium]